MDNTNSLVSISWSASSVLCQRRDSNVPAALDARIPRRIPHPSVLSEKQKIVSVVHNVLDFGSRRVIEQTVAMRLNGE